MEVNARSVQGFDIRAVLVALLRHGSELGAQVIADPGTQRLREPPAARRLVQRYLQPAIQSRHSTPRLEVARVNGETVNREQACSSSPLGGSRAGRGTSGLVLLEECRRRRSEVVFFVRRQAGRVEVGGRGRVRVF